MAERDHEYWLTKTEFRADPIHERVDDLYQTVLTGNGKGPLKGRVERLEIDMATVLPILNELHSAANRQEGRDLERLDAEKRHEKAWAKFRWTVGTIILMGMFVLALMEYRAHVQRGELSWPKISRKTAPAPAYTAYKQPLAVENSPAYTASVR